MTAFDIPEIPTDKVEEAKRKILKVWNMEDLDLEDPCILRRTSSKTRFGGIWQAPLGDYTSDIPKPTAMINDPELDLKYQLHAVRFDIDSLNQGYCNLPSIFPYFGICVIPSAFGCEIKFPKSSHPIAHPLFEDPQDVYNLRMPDLREAGLCKRVLDRIDYFQEKTKGKIPIRGMTVNCPLDVAVQLWGMKKFKESMPSHPKEIHHLMDLLTDAIIEFIKIQAERIENRFRYDHLRIWHSHGLSIIGDVSGLMTVVEYEELVRPYHVRISEAFDGISLRNCGQCVHVLPSYASLKGFQGFDVYLKDNDPDKVVEAISNKGALLRPLSDKEHIQLLRGKAGLFLAVDEVQGLNVEQARDALLRK